MIQEDFNLGLNKQVIREKDTIDKDQLVKRQMEQRTDRDEEQWRSGQSTLSIQ